jgi:tetratricopeptide (TPR) repeat protein
LSFANDCGKADQLASEAADLVRSSPAAADARLQEAIQLCGTSAALYYNRALVLYKQKRENEAMAELEKAIKVNPEFAIAYNALAYLIVNNDGDRERAMNLAKKAIQLAPDNKQYRDTYSLAKPSDVDIPPVTGTRRPDAVAIVIGNKNYRNTVLPAVKYAIQDVYTMKKYLVETLGFSEENIILVKDATNIDFVKYFGSADDHKGILYNQVRKDRSEVFVFYSGHGAPDTNTKKAYLVPSDADPAIIKLTGYSLDTLYDNLAKLNMEKNPKSITVVLDACFSGGSNEGMLIQNASPIYIETSIPLLTARNAVVLSSSKGNQISSWYPEKNHGLFTYYFLKNIKKAAEDKKSLTIREMESALVGPESVNELAWRLYNRDQEPQTMGNKELVLVQ